MKDFLQLREFIQAHPRRDQLVLCTLVGRQGSSYRALGAKKIVSLEGVGQGLLSGGCLEASIDRFARAHFAELPRLESFSTLSDEDRLFGYQTGCQGVITILFERIGEQDVDIMIPFGAEKKTQGVAVDLSPASLGRRSFVAEVPAEKASQFYEPWITPVHLVVIGAGLDAAEFISLSQMMGWSCSFFDHRRGAPLADLGNTRVAMNFGFSSLAEMARQIPEGEHVAVVLMTHNYEVDLELFRFLCLKKFGYFGALGPHKRYMKIKEDLKNMYGEEIPGGFRVFAPAGILPKGRTPESIALSIATQIQDVLVGEKSEKIWTLILAAGASQRFGGVKALAPWKGGTFLSASVETAREYSEKRVLVVIGARHEALESHMPASQGRIHNENWQQGMGSSIACGVREILRRDPDAEGVVILSVDQVLVNVAHLQSLQDLAMKTKCCALTANAEGEVSSPAFVPMTLFARCLALNSERGLKSVLKAGEMVFVRSDDAFADFDTPETIQRFNGSRFSGPEL